MLEDKVVIVTGGSSGIGKSMAEKFNEKNAKVVIADIDVEKGEQTAEEIGVEFRECDVSDAESVKFVVDSVAEDYGRLDVMVNNAGIGTQSTIEDMDIEEWKKVLEVDLDGVMYGTKAATPYLKETEGCVLNTASIYGLVGALGATAYNAAKGGVVNFTRSVANDLAQYNVRVNSICPGFVRTPMIEEAMSDEDFKNYVLNETPLGRVAEPEEIAEVAVFISSEKASYMTGANIPVDGGWTSH